MVVSRATWTTEGGLFGDQRVVVSRLASVNTVQFSQSVEVKSFGEVPVPLLLVKVSTAGGVRTLESWKLLLLNLATDQFSKFSTDRYTDTHTHTEAQDLHRSNPWNLQQGHAPAGPMLKSQVSP